MIAVNLIIQNVAIIKEFHIFTICFRIKFSFLVTFYKYCGFKRNSEIFIHLLRVIRTGILSLFTVIRCKKLNMRGVFIHLLLVLPTCWHLIELLLFSLWHICFRGPSSVVGIVTGHEKSPGPGIEFRLGRDFPHLSRPALGPTQPSVQWVPGLSLG